MAFECIICYELLGASESISGLNNCGHVFHRQCIEIWICRSQTCPQCREPCTEGNLIKLFLNVTNVEHNSSSRWNEAINKVIYISELESKINELRSLATKSGCQDSVHDSGRSDYTPKDLESVAGHACSRKIVEIDDLKGMNGILLSEKLKYEQDHAAFEIEKYELRQTISALERQLLAEMALKHTTQSDLKATLANNKVKTIPSALSTVDITAPVVGTAATDAVSRIPVTRSRRTLSLPHVQEHSYFGKKLDRPMEMSTIVDSEDDLQKQESPKAGPSGVLTKARRVTKKPNTANCKGSTERLAKLKKSSLTRSHSTDSGLNKMPWNKYF